MKEESKLSSCFDFIASEAANSHQLEGELLSFFENLDYKMMGPDDIYLTKNLKIIHSQSAKQTPKDTAYL